MSDYDLINDLQDKMEQATDEERMAEVVKHFPTFKIRWQKLKQGENKLGYYNRYKVTISNHEQTYKYTFNDSIYNTSKHTMSSPYCILNCAVLDAEAYDSTRSLKDYADTFGYDLYEDYKRTTKCFEGCQEAYDSIVRLFGSEGYEILLAIGSNY